MLRGIFLYGRLEDQNPEFQAVMRAVKVQSSRSSRWTARLRVVDRVELLKAARIHPDKNEAPGAHLAFIKLKDEFEAGGVQSNACISIPDVEMARYPKGIVRSGEIQCFVHVPPAGCLAKCSLAGVPKEARRARREKVDLPCSQEKGLVQPVLAIQDDMQILIQAQDLHRENGVPPQNLSKKMKHYRWEQAMLLRKADKNAAQHAKEAKAAEKQAEKDETIRQVRRRVKRANFGYEEEGLCPTYIPEELKDRFVVAANISEEESEANDAEMDEPLSFVSWLVSFFASCPCVGR
eukprot:symbB.v1.2.022857.t1/scaffold2032.1/size91878/9